MSSLPENRRPRAEIDKLAKQQKADEQREQLLLLNARISELDDLVDRLRHDIARLTKQDMVAKDEVNRYGCVFCVLFHANQEIGRLMYELEAARSEAKRDD